MSFISKNDFDMMHKQITEGKYKNQSACNVCKGLHMLGVAPTCGSKECDARQSLYELADRGYDCAVLPKTNEEDEREATVVALTLPYGYERGWFLLYRGKDDIQVMESTPEFCDLDHADIEEISAEDLYKKYGL